MYPQAFFSTRTNTSYAFSFARINAFCSLIRASTGRAAISSMVKELHLVLSGCTELAGRTAGTVISLLPSSQTSGLHHSNAQTKFSQVRALTLLVEYIGDCFRKSPESLKDANFLIITISKMKLIANMAYIIDYVIHRSMASFLWLSIHTRPRRSGNIAA